MPVIRSDLTDRMGPRGRRAEYTRKCGWIDWAHADPDRKDLKAIWSALYPSPQLPNGKTDTDRISLVRGENGGLYSYLKVDFELEMNMKLRAVNGFPKHNYTFFVKVQEGTGTAFYKRAALGLYLFGCAVVENWQGNPIAEWKAHSSWAMEDMTSNLMAFYQLVDGISASTLIDRAGGWTNDAESLKMSTAVFDVMDKKDAAQPKSSPGTLLKGYLFNDIADIDDKRGGWQTLPDYFWRVLPNFDWREDDKPGPGVDIGYEWDVVELHHERSVPVPIYRPRRV